MEATVKQVDSLEVTGYGAFAVSASNPDQVVDSMLSPIHPQPSRSQPQQARKHPQPTQRPSRIRCGVPQVPRKRVRIICEHSHSIQKAPAIPREHPQKLVIKIIITVATKT